MKTPLLVSLVFCGLLAGAAPAAVAAESGIPVAARLKFFNDYGKSWYEASEEDRSEFLDIWNAEEAAKREQEKIRQKELTAAEKEAALKARATAKEEREKLKAKRAAEKARLTEDRNRKRKLQKLIEKRKKAIRGLKHQQKRRRTNHR